jgi:hypothetical protein
VRRDNPIPFPCIPGACNFVGTIFSQCDNSTSTCDPCAQVFAVGLAGVQACFNCANASDPFAGIFVELLELCFLGTPNATTTVTGPAPAVTFDCFTQCAPLLHDVINCPNVTCGCSVILGEGPACSSCFKTVNASIASTIGEAISYCSHAGPVTNTSSATATSGSSSGSAVATTTTSSASGSKSSGASASATGATSGAGRRDSVVGVWEITIAGFATLLGSFIFIQLAGN